MRRVNIVTATHGAWQAFGMSEVAIRDEKLARVG